MTKQKFVLGTTSFIIAMIIMFSLYYSLYSKTRVFPVNKMALDFTVYDEKNNEVCLSDYSGKPIVVNFWASWCTACRSSVEAIVKESRSYPQVNFLMINVTDGKRETKESAAQYLKQNKFDFPLLLDLKGFALASCGVFSLPYTVFIDKNGFILHEYGNMIMKSNIKQGINKLINSSDYSYD